MKKMLLVGVGICVLFLMTGLGSAADSSVINGYVSDNMCGAKGSYTAHADCMKKCLAKGAKAVIVTDGDQKVLAVDNPDALKGHEGHHIAATGEVKGDSIHVDSVKML
jgi:hypothetical protein